MDIWGREWRSEGGGGGGMHPLERMRLPMEGYDLAPEHIENGTIMVMVDKTVLAAPASTKRLLHLWYREYRLPSDVRASRLGISRATLYIEWKASLHCMRGALRTKGLQV
jgi:hypothetical protein